MTDPDLNIKDVIDALDSFYCHNVVAGLWADAVANRLQGMAIYLLSDELPEVADPVREAAPSPVIPGSFSTVPPATPSSRSLTARTRGLSPATRCSA